MPRLAATAALTALLAAMLAAPAALALEDEATLAGQFTWIIPDDVSRQYPDQNLTLGSKHYVSELNVSRNAAGKFVIRVTLPTTLTGGQLVQSTYVQQSIGDNEMIFRNPERADDYLRCNIRDTWAEVRCSDVTLKGVSAVPAEDRTSYAQSLYEGTPAEIAMMAVAGAEPGGEIQFRDSQYEDVAAAVGTWLFTLTADDGTTSTGTMRLDGYNGTYRIDGAEAVGLITNVSYDPGEIHFDWVAPAGEGWADFRIETDTLTGECYLYPHNDFCGSWTAVKQ